MRCADEPDSLWFRNSMFQDRRMFEAEGATSVYCLLAFMSDDTGLVSTSIAELMEDTGASQGMLEQALSHLINLELIAPEPTDRASFDFDLNYRLRVGIDYRKLDESSEQ